MIARRRIAIGFGLPIAALVAVCALSYHSILTSTTDAGWVRHTHEVLGRLAELRSALQDIENGYRGFVIVGEEGFLASYEDGLAKAPVALATVATLTKDNPLQQSRIPQLSLLVARSIELADDIIRLRYDRGIGVASRRVADGASLRLMEETREQIRDMQDEEERLLVARQRVADRSQRWIVVALVLGILGSIAVLASAGWMVTRDATTRAEVEVVLRAAKSAADASNRTKSDFLANMSHEIRTPMNGVIGMTDLVLDTELTAEQRESMRIIKSSPDALLTVINDILDFSRMEAGKFELDPIDFNLRDAIGDTANTVALKAHQKGLELIVDIGADVPNALSGDPGRLRQILVNLLANAIKFTERGEVELRVTLEPPSVPNVILHFAVRDTGVGIPVDRQQRVFEAFTQVDGSVSRTHGGTGLGLTIASQLVRLMDGRLWLESVVGQGSTFHFTATLTAAAPALSVTVPDTVALQHRSVLVVDDNSTNRSLLEAMLGRWQMVPTLVADAPSALAALHAARDAGSPFPLVITDVQMPHTDGFTLVATLKQDPTLAGTAIVMLTSTDQAGDVARCRDLGVAAYLPKPAKASDLRDTILVAVAGRSTDQPRPALLTRNSLRGTRATGRILLVEDNEVNQLVASHLLERRGHRVVVTDNGREALARLDAEPAGFDCVLMDVQMPEMDGYECTAQIRDRERLTGTHLPIVAMTAHAMKGDEARCLQAGMDGYVSKPIQPEELFDAVERHLSLPSVALLGYAASLPGTPTPRSG